MTTDASQIPPTDRSDRTVHAIVLAGAHVWGSSALEQIVARPLLPIAGQPLIWHVLEWLGNHGIVQATLCANSDTPVLRAALGSCGPQGMNLDYYEDTMPRGPAGCARDAARRHRVDDTVVCDGTQLPMLDLQRMLSAHRACRASLTVAGGRSASHDAGASLHPTGVYVFSREALQQVPPRGYQDIKEALIPMLAAQGRHVEFFKTESVVPPRLSPENYLQVALQALEQLSDGPHVPSGYVRRGEAWVHHTAHIADGTRLMGTVWIGPRAVVEADAILVGPTCLGADNIVRRGAVVSCTVCWDRCIVAAAAVVDHCVLANDCHVRSADTLRRCVCLPGYERLESPQPSSGDWAAPSQRFLATEDH